MNDELKLTARGHAVCELMAELGLTLEAACAHVDHELEILRQRVGHILADSDWQDVPGAVRAVLASVSPSVRNTYLEESAYGGEGLGLPIPPHQGGASLH